MAFAKAVSICLEAWSLSSDLLHRSIYKRKPFVLFLVQVGIDKKGDRPPKNEAMVCQEQHKPLLTSRLTIMVLVAVMLVLTTLLTWYYTSLYSRHAVRSLTSILRSHVLKTSLQTISCALGQVHNISLALRSLHQQIIVKNSNASWPYVQDQICQSNWAIITSQPQLISAAFISEDSYSTGYTRVDDSIDLFFTNRATNASSPPSWYMQNVTRSLFGSGTGPPVEMILEPYQFNSANTERSGADHVLLTLFIALSSKAFKFMMWAFHLYVAWNIDL